MDCFAAVEGDGDEGDFYGRAEAGCRSDFYFAFYARLFAQAC